jgi:hypothetical protein
MINNYLGSLNLFLYDSDLDLIKYRSKRVLIVRAAARLFKVYVLLIVI